MLTAGRAGFRPSGMTECDVCYTRQTQGPGWGRGCAPTAHVLPPQERSLSANAKGPTVTAWQWLNHTPHLEFTLTYRSGRKIQQVS